MNLYIFHGKIRETDELASHSVNENRLTEFINSSNETRIGVSIGEEIRSISKKEFNIHQIEKINKEINIWLDDERKSPAGWMHVYTASECIALLIKYRTIVNKLSLDHDLGDDSLFGTGYDVAVWLEEQAFNNEFDFIPKHIVVHSQNNVAANRMKTCIENIKRK